MVSVIKVLVVDDHELVRTGIARILNDAPGIKVVAEADCGEEAIVQVRRHQPDVVLMDLNMPGMGGLEATRKLLKSYPELKIIVVTVHAVDPYPTHLLRAGVSGYLTKGCAVDEIINAIRSVHDGKHYIGAEVAQSIASTLISGAPFERLSQREMQVMQMIVQGGKAQDISDRLCLSPKTVSTYRHRIYEKLGVQSDVELAHVAMRYGMIVEARPDEN